MGLKESLDRLDGYVLAFFVVRRSLLVRVVGELGSTIEARGINGLTGGGESQF
jgi:hypothetical protein